MAVGDNFDIDTITAFDLLSFADESNISFRLLKKRILLIAGIVLNKVGSLQFYDFEINKEQAETIEELKRLVVRRANKLLDQSNQIDMVINTAF